MGQCAVRRFAACVGVVRGYTTLAMISFDGSRQIAMAVACAPDPTRLASMTRNTLPCLRQP